MHVSARSYLTAGVAFVGAGAIAFSPISPVNPTLTQMQATTVAASSVPVELSALVNPIELWAAVAAQAAANLGTLAQTFLANPAPILGKIAENQLISAQKLADLAGIGAQGFFTGLGGVPAALQAAFGQLLAGDISGGVSALVNTFLSPIIGAALPILFSGGLQDIAAILQNPATNISNVIGAAVLNSIGLGFVTLAEVVAPIAQIGATGQAIYDGVKAGDFEAVANALISFPSDVVNTILNGSTNPAIANGGLLSPNGLIVALLNFRQTLADAITPPALTPPPAENALAAAAPEQLPNLKAAKISVSHRTLQAAAPAESPAADDAGTVSELATDPAPAVEKPVRPLTRQKQLAGAGQTETSSPTDGAQSEKATSSHAKPSSAKRSAGDNTGKAASKSGGSDSSE